MAADWMESEPRDNHPNQEVILVKNDGDEKVSWCADGRPVHLEPGQSQRLPRWVFHLGVKYPGHNLREVQKEEAPLEYEKAQAAKLKREREELEKLLKEKKDEQAKVDAAIKKALPEKKDEQAKKE